MVKDTAEFIQLAKKKHKGKYTYDSCVFINARTKVTITCKVHKNFDQRPSSHLFGYGCKKCALENIRQNKLNKRIKKICPTCKTEFSFPISEQKKGRKYCSQSCSITAKKSKKDDDELKITKE